MDVCHRSLTKLFVSNLLDFLFCQQSVVYFKLIKGSLIIVIRPGRASQIVVLRHELRRFADSLDCPCQHAVQIQFCHVFGAVCDNGDMGPLIGRGNDVVIFLILCRQVCHGRPAYPIFHVKQFVFVNQAQMALRASLANLCPMKDHRKSISITFPINEHGNGYVVLRHLASSNRPAA